MGLQRVVFSLLVERHLQAHYLKNTFTTAFLKKSGIDKYSSIPQRIYDLNVYTACL